MKVVIRDSNGKELGSIGKCKTLKGAYSAIKKTSFALHDEWKICIEADMKELYSKSQKGRAEKC